MTASVIPIGTSAHRARKTTSSKDKITLAKLQSMNFSQLDRLYRQLAPPDTLSELNGRRRGYVLSVAGLQHTPTAKLVSLLGKSRLIPWQGISFTARSLIKGSGINRIDLAITRQEWFAFRTGFRTSLIDARPCVHMNYQLRGNPWYIRQLIGELRKVDEDLYLGAALVRMGQGRLKLLFFAIT
ncbi:MAG: hypothetical protein ACPHER_06260 [Nevskiales bacterium]